MEDDLLGSEGEYDDELDFELANEGDDVGAQTGFGLLTSSLAGGDGSLADQLVDGKYPQEVDVAALFPNSDDQAVPRVCNTICYANLGLPIDLRKFACGACFVEYNPKRNAGAILRIREPPCVAIVRNSGTMILTGASSVGAAKRGAELAARIIRKVLQLGDKLTQIVFRVKSVSVRFDLKHPIRLEELHERRKDISSYEPESFCGCIVRLKGPHGNPWSVVAHVFVSGKVTMTGARSLDEVKWAYHTLLPILVKHAKGGNPSALAPPPPPATAAAAHPRQQQRPVHESNALSERNSDFDFANDPMGDDLDF
jgi:transcription initiation factor TFIID TATA-box-binding protein